MINTIEHVATLLMQSLVLEPASVTLTSREGPLATVLEVRVHPDDVSRALGPRGRNLAALHQIFRGISAAQGRVYLLDIKDPAGDLVEVPTRSWEDERDYEELPTLKVVTL